MKYLSAPLFQKYGRYIFLIHLLKPFHSRITIEIWIIFGDFRTSQKSVKNGKIRKTKIVKNLWIFKFDTAMESFDHVDYKNVLTILLRQRSAEISELKERAAVLHLILLSSLTT